ncbi:unnamed protein product [Protopolystoma xenopodis]|uniref:SARAH domain-containing protein n=1 Tax=Protopolystoma xenopodis TaxID=117903 RepID=A0A448XM52_9PLAT|nr:unnamed protein product [Protopolystoma xenopodis]
MTNFLRILDKEEAEYRNAIFYQYGLLRHKLEQRMAELAVAGLAPGRASQVRISDVPFIGEAGGLALYSSAGLAADPLDLPLEVVGRAGACAGACAGVGVGGGCGGGDDGRGRCYAYPQYGGQPLAQTPPETPIPARNKQSRSPHLLPAPTDCRCCFMVPPAEVPLPQQQRMSRGVLTPYEIHRAHSRGRSGSPTASV